MINVAFPSVTLFFGKEPDSELPCDDTRGEVVGNYDILRLAVTVATTSTDVVSSETRLTMDMLLLIK